MAAARLGDAQLTLELAAPTLPRLDWNGDPPMLAAVLNLAAWALSDRQPETATMLRDPPGARYSEPVNLLGQLLSERVAGRQERGAS